MAFVYILQSKKNGTYYIGSTINIEQRVEQHNKGQVLSTKGYMPWELVFKQEFVDVSLARKQEIRLKKFKRRDYLERIISDGVILG